MPHTCPFCDRKLADSADGAEAPSFCMFCGHRLRGDTPAQETIDAPTQSFAPAADADTASYPEESDTAPPVDSLGGFKLVRFLGAGGMGAVYEGEHTDTGRRVAVKVLAGRLASHPQAVERFRQEGRVASQISHPHCVFVLAADADAGRPFIVMELMPGKTLKELVDERGGLPIGETIARALDVIDGLAEAHRLGVIHRDVKPSNCFLTADDRVKVGDFGLSKSLSPSRDGGHLTRSGAFLGTVLFASPEQIRGEPVGYDSDVYAVCATVYYLLAGRAPYQHESITAALAKAVSEPPPPLRPKRPEVPRELERVILRGLERDRSRRWQTLEELGDALRDLRPDAQHPARPRSLILAYIADVLLFELVVIPLDFLVLSAIGPLTERNDVFGATWFELLTSVLYFGLFDGLTGATPGKRLLRLRVTRVGETGPPGLWSGLVRSAVFALMWVTMTTLPDVFVGDWPSGPTGAVMGIGAFVVGLGLLLVQFRRTFHGYRGAHDFASGCRVVQRRPTPPRVRLVSKFPSPVDLVHPTTVQLPSTIGGYRVRGKVCDLPDGGEVWSAEDQSLGRAVLVRLMPPGVGDPTDAETTVTRPTRMRVIGHGTFVWEKAERAWVAFAAPLGSPLLDVVDPEQPRSWAEARPLLEQLVNELQASTADGTAVSRPTLAQVWVEPTGRLQLLDFPLPTATSSSATSLVDGNDDPLRIVREVATLTLEGKPRACGQQISAPIPPHASAILTTLFNDKTRDGGFDTLARGLAASHDNPAIITAGARAAHLSLQSLMLGFGLAVMFVVSGLVNLFFAVGTANTVWQTALTRDMLRDPELAKVLRDRIPIEQASGKIRASTARELTAALAPDALPETITQLDRVVAVRKEAVQTALRTLNPVERAAVSRMRRFWEAAPADVEDQSLSVLYFQLQIAQNNRAVMIRVERPGAVLFPFLLVIVIAWPLFWAAFAYLFRGGLSMKLAGIVLVDASGRPAGRFRCAVRELLVWAPITVVLLSSLWLQLVSPEMVAVRTVMWLVAAAMLPVYVLTALRYPTHPPQDRVMGTYLVPE